MPSRKSSIGRRGDRDVKRRFSLARLGRMWVYFRRGYAQFAFLISISNFLVIQYRLLVEPTFLHKLFPHFWEWVLTLTLTGLPLIALLGYWDYRRFSAPAEMAISARNNPFNRDFVRSLILLADSIAKIQDGETDKAKENLNKIKEIMNKWL